MVVVPLDGVDGLLEADVVEASERRAGDVLYRVIGHEKVLLRPSISRLDNYVQFLLQGLHQYKLENMRNRIQKFN